MGMLILIVVLFVATILSAFIIPNKTVSDNKHDINYN